MYYVPWSTCNCIYFQKTNGCLFKIIEARVTKWFLFSFIFFFSPLVLGISDESENSETNFNFNEWKHTTCFHIIWMHDSSNTINRQRGITPKQFIISKLPADIHIYQKLPAAIVYSAYLYVVFIYPLLSFQTFYLVAKTRCGGV